MSPLGISKRRKKELLEIVEKKAEEKTLLEDLCKGDNELYKVLNRVLLINPEMTRKTGEIDARAESALKHEQKRDIVRARIEYQVAGELALHEGKTALVQKFFKKAAEVDPAYPNKSVFEFFTKKENTDKALAVAQEYYARMAKPA